MENDVVSESKKFYYRFEERPENFGEIAIGQSEIIQLDVADMNANEDEPISPPGQGFWRRQFGENVTARQKGVDWTVGVILPLICFLFDPIVFSGGVDERAILGKFQIPAYILAFVSILAMTAWLLWGERLKWLNGWLAALFFLSSGISMIVGTILFPFSVVGMVILIGFLGFTPLFTSLVYFRNGVRAMRSASR